MLCIVYKRSVFVYMNKLASIFSRPSYSLVVLVINFCIVEPFNFTLYTKRTYMCDTCGLITANSTCTFGTSWSQLYVCPAVDHVSSNGGHCAQGGWMDAANCSSRPCSPDVYTYTVRVHARVRAIQMYRSIDRCVTPSALTVLFPRSDKETSDGLDGQDASRPRSVDGEAFPGGEQAPTQGRPPRRSAPDLSSVREGDLSDRLHQQDDRGTGVPSVQGPR